MNSLFIKSPESLNLDPKQVIRIFDLMPDLVYVINLQEQNLLYANDRLYDILGYTWDDVAQMNYSLGPGIIHENKDSFRVSITETFNSLVEDKSTEFVINFRHKNGEIRELRNRATVMTRLPNGKNHFIVVVAEDITKVKTLNLELERRLVALKKSNSELEQFAYVASHDLQEPLRKIVSFGERLNTKYAGKLGDEGKFFVDRMTNAANRMQVLIQDLLTYSRVARYQESFDLVNLNDILKQVLGDLDLKIQDKQATITFENLPTIQAHAIQMYQLFQNLFTNALKFTKTGVLPTISVKRSIIPFAELKEKTSMIPFGNYYCITVKDNGIGLENEYSERIFGLFQRLHGRTEYEGTGLGLAICRKIVEGHQGQITANGTLGEGTEFTIYLPETQTIIT